MEVFYSSPENRESLSLSSLNLQALVPISRLPAPTLAKTAFCGNQYDGCMASNYFYVPSYIPKVRQGLVLDLMIEAGFISYYLNIVVL